MENQLTSSEIVNLIKSVFQPGHNDKDFGILIDLPDTSYPDTPAWKIRRQLAIQWAEILKTARNELGFDQVNCYFYPNVHNNNADLPQTFYTCPQYPNQAELSWIQHNGNQISLQQLCSQTQILLAPTQFSATAPLKVLAKQYNFRAATMPGFSEKMIPALRLDYSEINQRVHDLKDLLDPSEAVKIIFTVDDKLFECYFDLRFRQAHASGGRFPEPGIAGNLPSGECYIVPYEGELKAHSLSEGILPVQFGEEVVLYKIKKNKAVDILSEGSVSDQERIKIQREPAYANIAEIGFGILDDFGLTPIGEILLDEKLGLHIAFGRSDHFGGAVGPKDFTTPDSVCHLDRIYLPQLQSRITVKTVDLIDNSGHVQRLMEDGQYTIF
ncbi:hypothetical protein ACFL4L_07435 [bacterium]